MTVCMPMQHQAAVALQNGNQKPPIPVDPYALLDAIKPLLNEYGGICNHRAAEQFPKVMENGKRLVSRCIYLNILKATETDDFKRIILRDGGWEVLSDWLNDSIAQEIWEFLEELIKIFLELPVTVEILQRGKTARVIKQLSADEGVPDVVRHLAADVVVIWKELIVSEKSGTSKFDGADEDSGSEPEEGTAGSGLVSRQDSSSNNGDPRSVQSRAATDPRSAKLKPASDPRAGASTKKLKMTVQTNNIDLEYSSNDSSEHLSPAPSTSHYPTPPEQTVDPAGFAARNTYYTMSPGVMMVTTSDPNIESEVEDDTDDSDDPMNLSDYETYTGQTLNIWDKVKGLGARNDAKRTAEAATAATREEAKAKKASSGRKAAHVLDDDDESISGSSRSSTPTTVSKSSGKKSSKSSGHHHKSSVNGGGSSYREVEIKLKKAHVDMVKISSDQHHQKNHSQTSSSSLPSGSTAKKQNSSSTTQAPVSYKLNSGISSFEKSLEASEAISKLPRIPKKTDQSKEIGNSGSTLAKSKVAELSSSGYKATYNQSPADVAAMTSGSKHKTSSSSNHNHSQHHHHSHNHHSKHSSSEDARRELAVVSNKGTEGDSTAPHLKKPPSSSGEDSKPKAKSVKVCRPNYRSTGLFDDEDLSPSTKKPKSTDHSKRPGDSQTKPPKRLSVDSQNGANSNKDQPDEKRSRLSLDNIKDVDDLVMPTLSPSTASPSMPPTPPTPPVPVVVPKPKPKVIHESTDFMAALNAPTITKPLQIRRKKVVPPSGGSNKPGASSSTTQAGVVKPVAKPPKLTTDVEVADKPGEAGKTKTEDGKDSKDPSVSPSASVSESSSADQPVAGKKNGKKKKVSWKEESDLITVHLFEMQEGERVNVNRFKSDGTLDYKHMEMRMERDSLQAARLGQRPNFQVSPHLVQEYRKWKVIKIDHDAIVEQPGSNSKERQIQAERQKQILENIFISPDLLPDTPKEPDIEITPSVTEPPKIIPLEDESTTNMYLSQLQSGLGVSPKDGVKQDLPPALQTLFQKPSLSAVDENQVEMMRNVLNTINTVGSSPSGDSSSQHIMSTSKSAPANAPIVIPPSLIGGAQSGGPSSSGLIGGSSAGSQSQIVQQQMRPMQSNMSSNNFPQPLPLGGGMPPVSSSMGPNQQPPMMGGTPHMPGMLPPGGMGPPQSFGMPMPPHPGMMFPAGGGRGSIAGPPFGPGQGGPLNNNMMNPGGNNRGAPMPMMGGFPPRGMGGLPIPIPAGWRPPPGPGGPQNYGNPNRGNQGYGNSYQRPR